METKESKEEFKYFVRIANTDLDGNKPLYSSLRKIKGVSFMFANLVCSIAKIDKFKKTGSLTKEESDAIDKIITNPLQYNAPEWMFNRRKDPEDNISRHLLTSNLDFSKETDLKTMKKIKSYKGVRHIAGLPVRGQRTKSNFRKNKGKVVGVRRSAPPKQTKE